METITPRGKCYHTVRHVFAGEIAAYYRKHPERLNDPAQVEATVYVMLKAMDAVLVALDGFEIRSLET